MTPVGIVILILIIGIFLFATVVVLRREEATLTDAAFPSLRPASRSREDVRAHRRETQAYLMEGWEARFEEAVGAKQLRDVYAKAKYERQRVVQRRTQAIADRFEPSIFGSDESALNRQYGALMRHVTGEFDRELRGWDRGISEVTVEYNKLMRKDRHEAIPTWRWPR